MIYFDNAATSFPKPKESIEAMVECLEQYCGNPGRSGNYFSEKTGYEVYQVRKKIAKLFNIKNWDRLIFTQNCTESLNLALKGTLVRNDHIIVTSMEHNSILRPLEKLRKNGVQVTIVPCDQQGHVDLWQIKSRIKKNTKMIACTHSSNVVGTILPIQEIGMLARQHGIIFLVDGAQTAGVIKIDVEKMCIDMLAAPGHKSLLGPQGTGFLYVGPAILLSPMKEGGTGSQTFLLDQPTEFPDGFEAGTINSPGIIGLGKSIDLIMEMGINQIRQKEIQLIRYIHNGLKDEINTGKIILYGDPNPENKTGIIAFNITGVSCEQAAEQLNKNYGIAVRSGFHCAPFAHMTIGTGDIGCIRASIGVFNTEQEARVFIKAIKAIAQSIQ